MSEVPHDPSHIHHQPLAALAAGRAAVLGHRDMGVLVMECTFQVGDKCVCILPGPMTGSLTTDKVPEVGQVYTVREVLLSPRGNPHIKLKEIVNAPRQGLEDYGERSFYAGRFRPVRTIDTTATVAALAQAMREAMKKGRIDA